MNTTTMSDEAAAENKINPGEELALARQERGFTVEYIANKLHLRARIIELIENNQFDLLPGPVFVKGYIRAYAKILNIAPEPYLAVLNEQCITEKKPERALWQSRRESHKAEHWIRWFTILFALGVLIAVGVWWQKNLDQNPFAEKSHSELSQNEVTNEIKLTDISKMQSLLNPKLEMSSVEKSDD